jgi:phosphoenolpyruvate-protein kinase (PTS system EI component)
VKRLLRHSTSRQLTELADQMLRCGDSGEIRDLLNKYLSANYPEQLERL